MGSEMCIRDSAYAENMYCKYERFCTGKTIAYRDALYKHQLIYLGAGDMIVELGPTTRRKIFPPALEWVNTPHTIRVCSFFWDEKIKNKPAVASGRRSRRSGLSPTAERRRMRMLSTRSLLGLLPARQTLLMCCPATLVPFDFSRLIGTALGYKHGSFAKNQVKSTRVCVVKNDRETTINTQLFGPNGMELDVPHTKRIHRNGPDSTCDAFIRTAATYNEEVLAHFVNRAFEKGIKLRKKKSKRKRKRGSASEGHLHMTHDDDWTMEQRRDYFLLFDCRAKHASRVKQRTPSAMVFEFSKDEKILCLVDGNYATLGMAFWLLKTG